MSGAHAKRGGFGGRSAPDQVELSAAEARRLALASLGLNGRRPGKPGLAHLRRVASRLGAIQIDSVNVLVRAHYMPGYSRLGSYPSRALDDLVHGRREMFEYIAHAACFIPIDLYPLFRWRMEASLNAPYWREASTARKGYVENVYKDVADRGPLAASEIRNAGSSKGNWWGWSDGKWAVEMLWRMGRVAVAGRRGFERIYDVAERVIPSSVLSSPAPSRDVAKKELLLRAAQSLGAGTAQDLAAYFLLNRSWADAGSPVSAENARLISELVEEGRLAVARVEGWKQKVYMVRRPKIPRDVHVRGLVSPFDPLMWERKWTLAMFGFDYKIEIYVPAPKRKYGYYALPFLLGDRFAARVDLKADRKNCVLLVPAAFVEPGQDARHVASELVPELRSLASWLGLERIEAGDRGDLVLPLARALR